MSQAPDDDPDYCEKHDLHYGTLSRDRCPLCKREHELAQLEGELAQRRSDPNMHPSVDAPRR